MTNITAIELRDGLQDGSIRIRAEDDALVVPPGATGADGSAYPDSTLRVMRGDEELFALPVWGCGFWQDGTLDSGRPGFVCQYDDGHARGEPQVTADEDDDYRPVVRIAGGDHVSDTTEIPAGVDYDDACQIADELNEMLSDAMPPVELPDGDEELAWLIDQNPAEYVTVDEDGRFEHGEHGQWGYEPDAPSVDVYAGWSLDRCIYAVEGVDELFDDAEAAGRAALKRLAEMLDAAAEALSEADYSPAEPELVE